MALSWSGVGAARRSSAATAASACSPLVATASSSAASLSRSSASSRVPASSAWRATPPSAFASPSSDTAAWRAVSGAAERASVGQLPMLAQPAQRGDGTDRAVIGERGQRGQTLHRGVTYAGVDVVAADGRERVRVGQSGHGGAADARVVVVGGHLGEHVDGRVVEAGDGLESDGRIAVLPSGLGSELVENAHGWCRSSRTGSRAGAEPPSVLHEFACDGRPGAARAPGRGRGH